MNAIIVNWDFLILFKKEHQLYCVEKVFFIVSIVFKECETCDGTGCLKCKSAYYLIHSECYSKYELTLALVLEKEANIFILSYKD